MWHEARRQEKKLRGLMVDYKKRAERRRNYYELCKKDPCSFLRLQGSSMRIHIDPAIVHAAEGPNTMMAWNNEQDNMIDRFDARAHLDHIPDYKTEKNMPDALEVEDDMRCNYDRYRIIVQNDCAKISEEASLRQIEIDEKYGDISKHNSQQEDKKKALAGKKAAIGFSYDDSDGPSDKSAQSTANHSKQESSDEETPEDFEDVDLDIAFDIDEINVDLKQQLDVVAITYGMSVGEFAEQLRKDKEDEQELREAKIAEQEKAAMSGRKSRKERRLYKETMLRLRGASPPKYIAPDAVSRSSPTYSRSKGGDSDSSRSASPVADTLEFITNLGDGDDDISKPASSENTNNLPPHLRPGASSSVASWKQRRMRSESPPSFMSSASHRSPPRRQDDVVIRKQSPPPPLKRYRKKSSDSDSSDEDQKKSSTSSYKQSASQRLSGEGSSFRDSHGYKSNTASKGLSSLSSAYSASSSKLSAQERLKRKLNSALNRTYRQDKRSTEAKKDQARLEQQERAEELKAQAEELRRKEFIKRSHRDSSSSSRSRSRSPSRSNNRSRRDYNGSSRYDSRDSRDSRNMSSRESRDRVRDHRSGRRSHSRSPTRRRNYR